MGQEKDQQQPNIDSNQAEIKRLRRENEQFRQQQNER